MKQKAFLVVFCLGLIGFIGLLPGQQQLTHDVSVVNIEVPVRVYDGNNFVSHLTMDDFEIYENGVLQKVEAVYLVKKTDVVQYSGGTPVVPNRLSRIPEYRLKDDESIKRRVFLLYFEMDEYPPQTSEAIDYFFENVLIETDTVLVVTPNEQWKITMNGENMARRAELAGEMKSRLAKSLRQAGAFVRSLIRDLHDLVFDDSIGKNATLNGILEQLAGYKSLNERRFRDFAGYLKPIAGQKHVFIFYREELMTVPSEFESSFKRKVMERRNLIDKETLRDLFSDADTAVHFIYVRKSAGAKTDVEYKKVTGNPLIPFDQARDPAVSVDMPGDIYQAFRDLALTTGGVVDATFNPVFAMKRVSDAAENYYLLYYTPTSSSADKSFKEIKVKVKSGNYRIIHRSGYVER